MIEIATQPASLQQRFCDATKCNSEDFRQKFFWKTVFRRSFPLSILIYWINRGYFSRELQLIENLANCTRFEQFIAQVDYYRNEPDQRSAILQWLSVRISSRRLIRLGRRFLR